MNEAIKKAIEGGWKPFKTIDVIDDGWEKIDYQTYRYEDKGKNVEGRLNMYRPLADPAFWQALGKSLGLGMTTYDYERHEETDWKWYWHRFIDHLAEGKDPEDFFKELLTNK